MIMRFLVTASSGWRGAANIALRYSLTALKLHSDEPQIFSFRGLLFFSSNPKPKDFYIFPLGP